MTVKTEVAIKPVLLRAADAATYLGISIREVRRLIKAGELDVKYVGEKNSKEYRVITASADAYFNALPSDKKVPA